MSRTTTLTLTTYHLFPSARASRQRHTVTDVTVTPDKRPGRYTVRATADGVRNAIRLPVEIVGGRVEHTMAWSRSRCPSWAADGWLVDQLSALVLAAVR
jgi:hypothetical protein